MPIEKVEKDSKEYFELKKKYESGLYTNKQLSNEYNITPMTLHRHAKEGKWQKGITKEIYDAKKIAARQEILDNFKPEIEKQAIQSINKKIINEVKKSVEVEMSVKAKELQAREKAQDILLHLLNDIADELINGSKNDGSLEEFEYDGSGKLSKKKVANKSSKYAIIKMLGVTELLKGTGVLNTAPSIAIQNNNTNTQESTGSGVKTVYVKAEAVEGAEKHINDIISLSLDKNNINSNNN